MAENHKVTKAVRPLSPIKIKQPMDNIAVPKLKKKQTLIDQITA